MVWWIVDNYKCSSFFSFLRLYVCIEKMSPSLFTILFCLIVIVALALHILT